ncbi:MAG: serine/threonine-protein kinase, partial [Leptolyngbyaceae cyanobacterium bins.59]|nr:serine/threonine-protein kinase [Leptolyngbyaceae cyanobacterium bins.59]
MVQVGQILRERYQLQRLLGMRPNREVWLAGDRQTRAPVVVKLLTMLDPSSWADLKLFEREARVLKKLSHPQIPEYLDFFEFEDQSFGVGLVETYIPGRSLGDCLQEGERFQEAELYGFAVQILEILIDLHELNPPVLHRDIKPSNLILGEDGLLYLVDFGAVQDRVTPPGESFTIVGTYGYTPIEQFGGQTVPASDLYALGATLVHLLTGVAPADLPQENLKIQFRPYTSASSEFIAWIEKLTNPSVQRRFQSARQALTALQTPTPGQQV